jgi:hypothetical protein
VKSKVRAINIVSNGGGGSGSPQMDLTPPKKRSRFMDFLLGSVSVCLCAQIGSVFGVTFFGFAVQCLANTETKTWHCVVNDECAPFI